MPCVTNALHPSGALNASHTMDAAPHPLCTLVTCLMKGRPESNFTLRMEIESWEGNLLSLSALWVGARVLVLVLVWQGCVELFGARLLC